MADVRNERGLHAVAFHGLVAGNAHRIHITLVRQRVDEKKRYNNRQESDDDRQHDHSLLAQLLPSLIEVYFVLHALHAVAQDNGVDRIIELLFLLQCFIGTLPIAGPLIEFLLQGIGFTTPLEIISRTDGTVQVALAKQVIAVDKRVMNRRQPLCLPSLIATIAIQELVHVAQFEGIDRTIAVDAHLPVVGSGACFCFVEQGQRFFRILIDDGLHQVHVDGRHALLVVMLLHALEHLGEALARHDVIATILVDMTQHVDGHIVFRIELLLTQLARQLQRKLISLEHFLPVEQEHNLVAALGIVGMIVLMLQTVIFEPCDMIRESSTVAGIE